MDRLKLPATLESLPVLMEFARAGAAKAGLADTDWEKLELVLEELLVNVSRYAYQPGTGDVELAFESERSGTLRLEISDSGRVFNPLDTPMPDLSAGLLDRPIGGLGLFLVRSLTDSLAYRREDGRNTVSFRFPGPVRPGT